ncbi:putative glucan endo-1,3-beta-glucosidase btgC [Aspergillus cristatus]|uniref:glucan endo-1,3-beta-D-glucosidase n=1 Tax=Aspergillus cristatus TaxID=573508 RepID=A0A1E3BII0_ASPCR|nr:putative glucan endo-1,3-beta-glucosidase btgC [Aspergillus cristatus]
MPRTFSFNNGDDREGPGSPISPVGTPPPSYQADPRTQTTAATPGMDNMGPSSVGGGIGGIALGVANGHGHSNDLDDGYVGPPERGYNTPGADNPYIPSPPFVPSPGAGMSSDSLRPRDSYGQAAGQSSSQNLLSAQSTQQQQGAQQPRPYLGTAAGGIMSDGPYQRNSAYSGGDYPLFVNPDEIIDDGDDGILPPGRNRGMGGGAAAGAAGGAALFKSKKAAADTTQYGPVPGAAGGAGAGASAAALEAGEKKHWSAGSKKRGWLVGLILGFIVVGAIVGGAVGGILGHRGNTTREKDTIHSASDDLKQNGDLDKDSHEIKELMNNKDLHKVFPGVDYTPWGVQYPLCLKYPPSQNNVTRDMAVLSQLTNTVRLYGTDCNQTEMVLHAIDRLELKDMRLWLGVWIESNQTTTDRQLKQLYKILDDTKDTSIFKGAIVGNEALFRAGSTKSQAQKNLIGYMNDVRDEIKKRNLDLPVATSDLGDNWNEDLAKEADLVMSNVHPFFAGVTVEEAASWTYTFWTGHDASLTKGTDKKQVISEVGWPSGGGNDCGDGNNCKSDTDGSVASVDNMNKFMEDWVCQALENGTDYFWFEAFDEPWKVQFNTEDEKWEDKWGLMDSARKLKPGLKIPDCGGKTAS